MPPRNPGKKTGGDTKPKAKAAEGKADDAVQPTGPEPVAVDEPAAAQPDNTGSDTAAPAAPPDDAGVQSPEEGVNPSAPLDPADLDTPGPAAAEQQPDDAGTGNPAAPLDPADLDKPPAASTVPPSAAAPLAPPPLPDPPPISPTVTVEQPGLLRYETERGEPIDLADVFDMSGTAPIVAVTKRVFAVTRPQNTRIEVRTLAFVPGSTVMRTVAANTIKQAKLAADRAKAQAELAAERAKAA